MEFPIASQARDLGSYLIPGQLNPIQVYELVHPQLPVLEHAGLQNLVRSPNQLTHPIDSLYWPRKLSLKRLPTCLLNQNAACSPWWDPVVLAKPAWRLKPSTSCWVLNLMVFTMYPWLPIAIPLRSIHPIADALNLSFNNPGDQIAQLIDHIKHRRMLLLLDNFEHLLPAAPFLINLLEGAPGLRLLLTSRERMNLQMETIFEVHGLPYPHASG